jgi:hypothetical protein
MPHQTLCYDVTQRNDIRRPRIASIVVSGINSHAAAAAIRPIVFLRSGFCRTDKVENIGREFVGSFIYYCYQKQLHVLISRDRQCMKDRLRL